VTLPDEFDLDVFGRHLELNVPGFRGLKAIKKFASGQSNPTYLLSAASGAYVLRAKPRGELLRSAHQVDREFRVLKALSGTALPVAAPLYLSEDGAPIGRMYFVMAYVDGLIICDPTAPQMASNSDRAALYDAMNATLATLHAIAPAAIGLADYGKPGNYYQRQYDRLSKQYRASETEALTDMEGLLRWLGARRPPDDGAVSLVHGDYQLGNMVTRRDRPAIAAVLDWELSTIGHPLADLAYQCMTWRLPYASAFRGLGGVDRASIGVPSEAGYAEAYCRRRGIGAIPDWSFYLAFSFFRLAAISQGVYKRALDGNASDPRTAGLMGEGVKLLARMGAEIAEREPTVG
jgi:aminoglycoside phosphotransferase (APT) family kinase protein